MEVDSDLEIYAKHLNLSEDFEGTLWGPTELQRMRLSDWIVTLFHFNVQNADINSQLQDELPDMRMDLEAHSLFKRKKTVWQCHVNTAVKYPKFCEAVEPFLLAFSISYTL